MNGYNLTRAWYDFKFDNVGKVKAVHSDMYFYIIDLWNRLGQKDSFGLPTSVTMEALGINSYNTFKKVLDDLIEFNFIVLISESKNQHSSKVIALVTALSKNDKATDKALDKAHAKATDKALDKASNKALDSITKQLNNRTNEQLNNEIKEIKEKEVFDFQPEIILKPKSKIELIDEIFSFEKFWAAYPNKIGKVKCEQKYYALTLQEIQKIKDTVQQYAAYKQFKDWTHPNPETYLNQKRWNDVLTISTQPKGILLDPRIKKSAVH